RGGCLPFQPVEFNAEVQPPSSSSTPSSTTIVSAFASPTLVRASSLPSLLQRQSRHLHKNRLEEAEKGLQDSETKLARLRGQPNSAVSSRSSLDNGIKNMKEDKDKGTKRKF
ncbi:hypothetical protein PIB30_062757, partial [Stylosanthes scabra]|nr:hypothetical protein [Stylosanthes scabra]